MSEPPPKSAKNRTGVTIETGPLICGRCRHTWAHFAIEQIDGIQQLRCGDVLIPRIEMTCLHCGWTFHWNVREKDLEKMTLAYNRLSANATYRPE